MLYKGEEIAAWGDPNKAAGYFGTDEISSETIGGDFDSVPVIELSGIFSADLGERKRVAAEIRDACVRVGFFYAKGHGIPPEMIDETFEWAKKFFALSYEEKMEIFINNQKNYRGYTPFVSIRKARRGRNSELVLVPSSFLFSLSNLIISFLFPRF